MKNNLNIRISNLTLSKRAKRDHNLALYPFIKPFLFLQCVLWGCGLYLAHATFLLSIMHIYLHVEFFFELSYIHQYMSVCYIRGCGWKMLQYHMEATQLANIFSYHTHLTSISNVSVWSLLVYLPLWTASISKLSSEWLNVLCILF